MSAVFWLNNTDECSKKANTGQRVRWKKPVIIAFTTKLRQETNAAQATLLYKLKPLNLLHVFRINVSPGLQQQAAAVKVAVQRCPVQGSVMAGRIVSGRGRQRKAASSIGTGRLPAVEQCDAVRMHDGVAVQQRHVSVLRSVEYVGLAEHVGCGGGLQVETEVSEIEHWQGERS